MSNLAKWKERQRKKRGVRKIEWNKDTGTHEELV